jgi:hypothetical protein
MRNVNIMLTEMSLSGRFALGQPTFTGVDTDARIQMGQDKALLLPDGASFNYVTPNADINGMMESVRFAIDSVAQANNVKINWTNNQAESGLSKKMGQLDLMDALRSDTEQIYRPFEQRQFEIASRIAEVSGGKQFGDQFSVDFSERETPMSMDESIKYYDWAFKNNLETRKSYLRKHNPDLDDKEIDNAISTLDEESPNQVSSLLDRIGSKLDG